MTNKHDSVVLADPASVNGFVVVVAVLTFRRPATLNTSLPLILSQVRECEMKLAHSSISVLVVDNDPGASARATVMSMSDGTLRYAHELQPGISAARNRALNECAAADILVFIDDDERPNPLWLDTLLTTWLNTSATAVMGRVISEFEIPLDAWVAAGDFFWRKSMETGTSIPIAAAGNLLLDLNQVRRLGLSFESKLGLSGGEDTLFSHHLTQRGGKIIWCDESVATDFVPVARTTRRWVLTRAWSHGNTAAVVDCYLARGSRKLLIVRLSWVGRGLVRMAGGLGSWLAGLLLGRLRPQARGLRTSARGAGMLAGAVGFVYQEYRR